MGIDHLAHPERLAAEVEIVGAISHTGRKQLGAVKLIRTDGRDHGPGLVDHGFQRRGIAGVCNNQRCVGGRADGIAHRSELVRAASGQRPFRIALAGIMCREIFSDELAGEAGGAIDNDVEFRRRLHIDSLGCFREGSMRGYFLFYFLA